MLTITSPEGFFKKNKNENLCTTEDKTKEIT